MSSSIAFGRATPTSPADSNVMPRDHEGWPSTVNLTETQLCLIIYALADSDITPFKWDDPHFDQEKSVLLQVLADDLRLKNVANPTILSPFIKRLLNTFARANLLQVQLDPNGVAALTWPKKVADADTLRDIGAWLRSVGLDGFDPARLQGAQADQYLDTVVDCILNKRSLHISKGAPASQPGVSTPKTSAGARARTPVTARMSGAIREMENMDSRLVTDASGQRRLQRSTAGASSSQPGHHSESPIFATTAAGTTGAPSFNGRGMPTFTRSSIPPTPRSRISQPKAGGSLPDAINNALEELAVLGSYIYTRNSAPTPAHDTAMDRYRQLSRFISQAGTDDADDQNYDEEYEQEYEDLESSLNLSNMSEGGVDDLIDGESNI